jgi:hypothetical protein
LTRAIGIALLAFATLSACASADVSGERRNVGNVTATFTIGPARPRAGQVVRLTLRLVNNGGTAAELEYPSAQRYDFWVTRGAKEVWRWSEGRVFAQELTRQTIEGQSGTSFAETWTASSPGAYVAHAELKASGYDDDLKGDVRVQ